MENDTAKASVLPADFDGIFRFTNWTADDFTARWNGIDYTFPAEKTSPMIIPSATPEEVQHIRMKFAKQLGEREYFNSDKYKALNGQTDPSKTNSFHQAGVYTEGDIAQYTQRCLEPMPAAPAKATKSVEKPLQLRKDEEGNPVTQVITDTKKSLKGNGAEING